MPTGYESVPQGRVNTGGAVVFDTTESTGALAGNLAALINKPLIEQALKQKRVAELGKSYATGDADVLKPTKGTMYTPEINQIVSNHLKKGSAYKAAGFDIYNPDYSKPDQVAANQDYMKERNQLMSMIGTRDKMEEWQNDMVKSFDETKHDPESLAKLKSFFEQNKSGTRLQEMFFKGTDALPTLSARFNQQKFLNGITLEKDVSDKQIKNHDGGITTTTTKAVDDGKIRKRVVDAYKNDPQAQNAIEKEIGISLNGIYGTTDINRLREIKRADLMSDEGKQLVASAGISDYNGEPFKAFLEEETKQQLEYEKKFDDIITSSAGNVKARYGYSETDSTSYAAANYQRALTKAVNKAAGAGDGIGAGLTDRSLPLGVNNPDGSQVTIQGKRGLPFTTAVMNMVSTKAIDAYTGAPINFSDSSSDIAIAGLYQMPILKKDIDVVTTETYKSGKTVKTKKTLKAGSFAQPDYAEKHPDSVSYKKVGVGQTPKSSGKGFTTVYVDAESIPQNGFSKKSQAEYDAFIREPIYQQKQGQPEKAASQSSSPKKGQTMAVQGGTAIFDGTKWVMKK